MIVTQFLLYLLFENKRFTNISKKEIKSNNIYGKGIVTKFSFIIGKKIKVNIVTGNIFKNKLRKIKIILNNKDYIEGDMIEHEVKINSNLRYKGTKTPVRNLFDKLQVAFLKNQNQEN